MYLIDTDVISELRKKDKADPRVAAFLKDAAARNLPSERAELILLSS